MQPSDLLVAAADRIRDLAVAWDERKVNYSWVEASGFTVDGYTDSSLVAANVWMRALSPAVAPALEQVLRNEAEQYRHLAASGLLDDPQHAPDPSLLDLARALCPELAEARVQCSGAVHNLSLSAPERCALEEGHEGTCES